MNQFEENEQEFIDTKAQIKRLMKNQNQNQNIKLAKQIYQAQPFYQKCRKCYITNIIRHQIIEIQSDIKLKYPLFISLYKLGMEQESISQKKNGAKVRQYQKEYQEFLQELKKSDIEMAQQTLFGNKFNALSVSDQPQFNFDANEDTEIYISHLRSNNQLLKAKQDIYTAEGYANSAQGNIHKQNQILSRAADRAQNNDADLNQANASVNQMQRRIDLNKCLLYGLFAFIILGFLFIIIYKVFL